MLRRNSDSLCCQVAEEQTNKLLVKVQSETVKAEAKAAEVGAKKDDCLQSKAIIESNTIVIHGVCC